MKFIIQTPTMAYLKDYSSEEIGLIKKQLSFIRSSITYQLGKLKQNQWFKRNNPEAYDIRLNELEQQKQGCLLYSKDGRYWIRPGNIPWLKKIKSTVENKVEYPNIKKYTWKKAPEFTPYHYQTKSMEELIKIKHGNVSLPTGCGKSFILVLLAQQLGLKTVIVTPSKSIFNELLDEFTERFGKLKVGGYGDGKKDLKKPITIAIGKSLTMIKEGSEADGFFRNKQVMAIDESHTFAAEQLDKVCHGVLADIPYRFFVSATQTRNDGTSKVLESIIGENVLNMTLEESISGGFLCPLKFTIIKTFSPSGRNNKDPMKTKRIHFLYNEQIAKEIAKIANLTYKHQNKCSLILVEELQQIAIIKKYLTIPFTYIHSASKKDAAEWGLDKVKLKDELLRFNKGEVGCLIGTKAIATGTNIYPTHNTFNWAGSGSEIVTKQGTMGRSTRKLEISKFAKYHTPKPFSHIFDFYLDEQPMLNNQLRKRIECYKESGGEIKLL